MGKLRTASKDIEEIFEKIGCFIYTKNKTSNGDYVLLYYSVPLRRS